MVAAFSERLQELLAGDEPVLVLTGAGVSAESGLATFRGPDGLWNGRDPMEMATPEAFRRDPLEVWKFYDWRRKQAAAAKPNAGHLALAAWQRHRADFQLVTQNVDGLHERAGSENVLALHGTLWILRCTVTGRDYPDRRVDLGTLPPTTPEGDPLRPGVVWFGESLDGEVLAKAARTAERARLVIVAGTSSLVHPAAGLPMLARQRGAYVVEINPERTPLSDDVDERLEGPSGTWLPKLAAAAGVENVEWEAR